MTDIENNQINLLGQLTDKPAYDAAGNQTKDKDSYEDGYDYENRIVKITKSGQTKVEFAYDALGRRIRKVDSIADDTTLYYYNNDWQVLEETDENENTKRWYLYGNYIDEVLMMVDDTCLRYL